MNAVELVAHITSSFDVDTPPSDATVINALVERGVTERQADVAVKLVQIACGRIFLDRLGVRFSDDYLCVDAAGKVVESGQLSLHPVFSAALTQMKSAPRALKYLSVTSSDVQSVSKLMKNGSRPERLVISPSVLFVEVPSEAGLAAATEAITKTLQAMREASRVNEPVKRPWWKLW